MIILIQEYMLMILFHLLCDAYNILLIHLISNLYIKQSVNP
jgi:hypothetical protein